MRDFGFCARTGDPEIIFLAWTLSSLGFDLQTHHKSNKHNIKPIKAIIFDQTRYSVAVKGKLPLPDFKHRNTETQYWVWWPRESAAKGRTKGLNYEFATKSGWDSAFNLTASYRRDSDINRILGTAQVSQDFLNQFIGVL